MVKKNLMYLGAGVLIAGAYAYARTQQPERIAGGGGGGGTVFNLDMIRDAIPETVSSVLPTTLNIPTPDFSFIPEIIKSIPVPDVTDLDFKLPDIDIPSLPEIKIADWLDEASKKVGDLIDTGKDKIGDLVDDATETAKDLLEKSKELVPVKEEKVRETFLLSSAEIEAFRRGEEKEGVIDVMSLYERYGFFGALGKGFANLGAIFKQSLGFLAEPVLLTREPFTTWGVPALQKTDVIIKEPASSGGLVTKTLSKVLDVTSQSQAISNVSTPLLQSVKTAVDTGIDMAKRSATVLLSQGKISLSEFQSQFPSTPTSSSSGGGGGGGVVSKAVEVVKEVVSSGGGGGGSTISYGQSGQTGQTGSGAVGSRTYTFSR